MSCVVSADLFLGVIYCWSRPINVTAGCMSQYHAINSAIKEGNCIGGIGVAVVDRSTVIQVWPLTQSSSSVASPPPGYRPGCPPWRPGSFSGLLGYVGWEIFTLAVRHKAIWQAAIGFFFIYFIYGLRVYTNYFEQTAAFGRFKRETK